MAGVEVGISGINVTMPHKADAARACDHLTETAAALGSVNTVVVNADGSAGCSSGTQFTSDRHSKIERGLFCRI